jgi:hypothetical protein
LSPEPDADKELMRLAFNTRKRRFIATGVLAAVALLVPSLAQALPVTPTFNWRASAPGSDPAEWNATIGSHQWSLSGASQTTPSTSLPGITGAIDFAGGDTATATSFQTIQGGNPSNEDVTLEMWFRPDSLTGGQQVLFETGGNLDGLSILLNGSNLEFRVKDNGTVIDLSYDLGLDASEFFQVAITLSLDGTASLYVDGLLQASIAATNIDDWTNNNGAGIGTVNGQLGGNDGGDLDLYGDFLGEIAMLRFYRNQVLTGAEVLQNYSAIATPEPGTALLVAIGLIGLAIAPNRLRRRRRRPTR